MKIREQRTQSGKTRYLISGKNANTTFRKLIELAVKNECKVNCQIECSAVHAQNDYAQSKKMHLTFRYILTAQELLDRIDNPQGDDNWKTGDVRKALIGIMAMQHSSYITSIKEVGKITLWAE